MKFWKTGIRNPFLVIKFSKRDKTKYCFFRKGHGHTINECIRQKDAIEGLIKRGLLSDLYKGRKKRYEKLSMRKSISKTVYIAANGEWTIIKDK